MYRSTGDAIVKADKFSEFMIIWRCTTEEEGDGCCMISEEDGTLCVVRGTKVSEMFTYRYSLLEWEKLMTRYINSQEDYLEYLGTPYKEISYLDAFSCA